MLIIANIKPNTTPIRMQMNVFMSSFTVKPSNSRELKYGTPCRARTYNHWYRKLMLYPVELMARKKGRGDLPHPCLRLRY